MKSRFRERFWWTAAVLLMSAVLVTLGVLQYRWSGAVSEAASVRMQASLQSSVWGFRQELHRDLAALCPPPRSASSDFATQLSDWGEANAEHADLVTQLYWWQGVGGPHPKLQRFDATTHQFSDATWPANLVPLSQWIHDAASHLDMMMGPHAEHSEMQDPAHRRHPHLVRVGSPPCVLDENTPALVRPVALEDKSPRTGLPEHDWLVVVLDQRAIAAKLLPELSTRYFGGANGLDFDAAVLGGPEGHDVIYTTNKDFKPHAAPPDAEAPLFGFFALAPGRPGTIVSAGPPPSGASTNPAEPARNAMFNRMPDAPDWLLVVRHRNGSLEQTVERARKRNLAISFGILLLLALTMALIVVMTHRAQRLARLQMEFVTGVSHELRTPLTVIASAAQNLSDGIVSAGPQVARYGSAIKEQAEQLKALVEQILLFAATRDGQYRYNLRPVAPRQIVDAALAYTAELVRAAGVKVETSIAPGLPPVMADLSAISRCLQNLISNAVKYGGDSHWVGIEARAASNGRGNEVQISVADKGIGLRGRELERIFEPFYRGDEAISAQIHGTGLGLTLARSIAEGMGGTISVSSTPGAGSVFTLHLPATSAPAETPVAETIAR